MKKSDKPTPSEPSSTATPPIESTPAPESKPPETPPAEVPKVETVATPPIGDVKPVESTPANVETISAPPISNEPPPVHQAEPLLPQSPAPVKPFSGLSDWMQADWNKSNADLARENNVTRQAVAQMRKKVEAEKAKGNTPTFSDVTRPDPAAAEMVSRVVDYDVMAATVFDMSTGLLTTTLGPEWQPRPAQEPGKPGERDMVCMALKVYFQSKQAQDIPPGLMLTAVIIAYAGPRLRAPSTSSKLQMAWTWLKLKLSKFKKKQP
jgi:hypothetical protein